MTETLGSLLRAKREVLGLSVEDVEKKIHIRACHLRAIEADDLTAFPSVPQARGFIRNYAAFLGVSEEDIRNQTGATRPRPAAPVPIPAPAADATIPASRPDGPHAAPPSPPPVPDAGKTAPMARTAPNSWQNAMPRAVKQSPLKRWLSGELVFGGAVGLLVIGFFLWGAFYLIQVYTAPAPDETTGPLIAAAGSPSPEGGTPTPDATAPGDDTPSAEAPSEVVAPLPVTLTPTAFPTPLGGIYTTVHIRLEVLLHAFLVVELDGKEHFRDRARPGQVIEVDGTQLVRVGTGNGAAVRVVYNGVDQGLLGGLGAVVWRAWNLAGPVAPTAAPTPTLQTTGTITPTPGG